MTIPSSPRAHRRIRPITEHAYILPVVRELPPQPPRPMGTQSLW